MFTVAQRDAVRERVMALARSDTRVSGGALTGSAATGAEDRWSDIDVAFGIVEGVEPAEVLEEWTRTLSAAGGVQHHFDLRSGAAIYRVFLLPDCLELDLAVAPEAEFGAVAASFELVFGASRALPQAVPPSADHIVGLGWHHALHARAATERGRPWLAEYWVSALRDHALTLACLRLGRPAVYARGADDLGEELTSAYEQALVRSLEPDELRRARRHAVALFLDEVSAVRPELADALEALREP